MAFDLGPFAAFDEDVTLWSIRAFYIFAAYAIIIVRFIPDLRRRFLDYGARSSTSNGPSSNKSALPKWVTIQLDPVLDWLADMTVPHSWFTHFYLCSAACSAYWLYQHFHHIQDLVSSSNLVMKSSWEARSMICMVLLQLQSLRRLYECIVVAKKSRARMWVGHYAIGLAFYLVTNVAVWIETSESANVLPMFPPIRRLCFQYLHTVTSCGRHPKSDVQRELSISRACCCSQCGTHNFVHRCVSVQL